MKQILQFKVMAMILVSMFYCSGRGKISIEDSINQKLPHISADTERSFSDFQTSFLDMNLDTVRKSSDFNFKSLLNTELKIQVSLYDLTVYSQPELDAINDAEVAGNQLPSVAIDATVLVKTANGGKLLFAGKTGSNGALVGKYQVSAHSQKAILEIHKPGFHKRAIEIENIQRLAKIDRTLGMAETAQSNQNNSLLDTDGDLIPDVYDAFPEDADRAFKVTVPADDFLTVAFEDNFPGVGDADFNDFIAHYRITKTLNANNEITELQGESKAVARLAGYDHRFGLYIPFEGQAGSSVIEYKDQNGALLTRQNNTVTGKANIVLFENTKSAFSEGRGFQTVFTIAFSQPAPAVSVPDIPFDPYLYIHNTGYDVHLLGYSALEGSNNPVGSEGFRDANGFPRALLVPMTWQYPRERVFVENAYLNFENWRTSSGLANSDWYLYPEESLTIPIINENASIADYPMPESIEIHFLENESYPMNNKNGTLSAQHIVARKSISIAAGSTINGHMYVTQQCGADCLDNNSEVTIEDSDTTSYHNVVANHIVITGPATIAGKVSANNLQADSAASVNIQETPVGGVPEIPTFLDGEPGSENVNQQDSPLRAGQYASLNVANNSTVILLGGYYQLEQINLGQNSMLRCHSTCIVTVEQQIRTQAGATIQRGANSIFFVKGANQPAGGTDAAIYFGNGSTISTDLFALNGDIVTASGCTLAGMIIANRVALGGQNNYSSNDAEIAPVADLPFDETNLPAPELYTAVIEGQTVHFQAIDGVAVVGDIGIGFIDKVPELKAAVNGETAGQASAPLSQQNHNTNQKVSTNQKATNVQPIWLGAFSPGPSWIGASNNAIASYFLDNALNASDRQLTRNGAQEWRNAQSTLNLREIYWFQTDPIYGPDYHYIHVYRNTAFNSGCFAFNVGKIVVDRPQSPYHIGNGINLGICYDRWRVAHEFAHTLGFWHEQSRDDRDNYLQIHWANIIPEFQSQYTQSPWLFNVNFGGEPMSKDLGRYDYDSIMHYSHCGFSVDPGGCAFFGSSPTFTQLQPGPAAGQRNHLSDWDIWGMEMLYGCHKVMAVVNGSSGTGPLIAATSLPQLSTSEGDNVFSGCVPTSAVESGITVSVLNNPPQHHCSVQGQTQNLIGSSFAFTKGGLTEVTINCEQQFSWFDQSNYTDPSGYLFNSSATERSPGEFFTIGRVIDGSGTVHHVTRGTTDYGLNFFTLRDRIADSEDFLPQIASHAGLIFTAYRDSGQWVIERSTDGGGTWPVVDTFNLGGSAFPRSLVIDKINNIIYVIGDAMVPGFGRHCVVRRSTNLGNTWSTVLDYTYTNQASCNHMTIDSAGNLFVAASGGSTSPFERWLVLKGTSLGTSWQVIDDYAGLAGKAHARLVATTSGRVVATGYDFDGTNGHWIVRTSDTNHSNFTKTFDFIDKPNTTSDDGSPFSIGVAQNGRVLINGWDLANSVPLFFISDSNGTNWQVDTSIDFLSLAFIHSSDNRFFGTGTRDGVNTIFVEFR